VLLVDTSVWIEVFRKPSRLELHSVADLDEVVTVCRHSLTVLHHDRDFSLLAQVSQLKERRVSLEPAGNSAG
jgi:predicted nucleic acid-binding protein